MARAQKKWFRLYVEVLDDPKAHRLSDSLFRFWVNCLCLAARNDGVLPSAGDIAHHVRKPLKQVASMMESLAAPNVRLLDPAGSGQWEPHNWKGRQYESDSLSSTQRVRKFRERNNGETFHETFQKQDETAMKQSPSVSVSVSGFKKLTTETKTNPAFRVFWNRWCELTKRKQREGDACRAWLSVVETEEQAQSAMACLERYGASSDVASGAVTNPDKWLFEQARDGWRGDWQPPRKKRDADEAEVARKMGMIE